MTLSEIKEKLAGLKEIAFELPKGELVPEHFHVTEVGKVYKKFIDCGGTLREEEVVNFQLWNADDYNHRLHPEKLVKIIELSEKVLSLDGQLKIEVEYQGDTIGKFGLGFDGKNFLLLAKQTDCLAKSSCGIPENKPKVRLSDLTKMQAASCCSPESGCC